MLIIARVIKNIFTYTTVAFLFGLGIASLIWLTSLFDLDKSLAVNFLAWLYICAYLIIPFIVLALPFDVYLARKLYMTLKDSGVNYLDFIKKDADTRRSIYSKIIEGSSE